MPVTIENNVLHPMKPTLLVPTDAKGMAAYPFDEAATGIFHVLRHKGWDVPGVDVNFAYYGDAHVRYLVLQEISGGTAGNKWKVRFYRPMQTVGKFNLCTGVSEVIWPKHQLSVYSDGSGPTLNLYVGKDWKADEEWFHHSGKYSAKLHKEPRRSIRYSGSYDAYGMLEHRNDDREYAPKGNEPKQISKYELFKAVDSLLKNIHNEILSQPDFCSNPHSQEERDARLDSLLYVKPLPVPRNMPELYVLERPYMLPEKSRDGKDPLYVLPGTGTRLCRLGSPLPMDLPLRDVANDGFQYGFADYNDARKTYLGSGSFSDDSVVFRVKLKYGNDVYVIDEEAFLKARESAFQEIKKAERSFITDAQLDETTVAAARTLVRLQDYTGGYSRPVYLIGRPLAADEAKKVGITGSFNPTQAITRVREKHSPKPA